MPSRRRTRYLRLVVGTTIAPVTQWTKLFSQTDTFRKSGLQRWPLGLREPAAFAHCISPLSLDETRDMQGGITHSNRRRTPSGRFEPIENTSTSCRLTTISLKLLDYGVNGANSGSTDESHERLCVKNASLDGRAPLEMAKEIPDSREFGTLNPLKIARRGFSISSTVRQPSSRYPESSACSQPVLDSRHVRSINQQSESKPEPVG